MKERLEEAESMGVRRMKAQVQAMEGRVSSLEEQLDAATRYEEWERGGTGKRYECKHTFCTCMYIHLCSLAFFFKFSCLAFAFNRYMCRHL